MRLNFVVALPAEARFFIEQFKLKQIIQNPFSIFSSDEICLIVSGIGSRNAAMATTHLAATQHHQAHFINIGIAGHQKEELGAFCAVSKIIDSELDKNYYPYFSKAHSKHITLETMIKPQTCYEIDLSYDMEGAGFYTAASRYVPHEKISLYKIISDNAQNSIQQITKDKVIDLFYQNKATLINVVKTVLTCSEIDAFYKKTMHNLLNELLSRYHFTKYQQSQLKLILRRCVALDQIDLISKVRLHCRNASDFMKKLDSQLNQQVFALNDTNNLC